MWTLPNLLTLARIAAIGPVLWAIQAALWWPAAAIFAVAAATDWLDGWIARRYALGSEFGRFLDPLADKLMVAAALIALIDARIVAGASTVAVVLIVLREIVVAGLREYLGPKGVIVHVSALAKWKTATQLVATAVLIASGALPEARAPGLALLWLAAALGVASAWGYGRAAWPHMRAR